jgi:tRNA 5-methylaminomethyl-2-thiouridine biosynthesis bifunctional protein
MPITPARLSQTDDGTPYAPVYDDVYHSRAGALAQARHVFLSGNGLPGRWCGREHFVVVETGFGLGLNFLATWAAWHKQPKAARCRRLHFISVEKHPLLISDLTRLLAPYQNELPTALIDGLIGHWPLLTEGTHRIEFDQGRVILTLILGDAETALAQVSGRADAIYLDGFSPAKNPAIWSDVVCTALARLSGAGTTLATWSVNGALRRRLSACGFEVAIAAGFAQKREMLTGAFRQRRPHPNPGIAPGHALIIGAGLAGTATAERLVARGWRCTLVDAGTLASGASGNRAGVIRPLPSVDDNLLSRLTRAGFLSTLHRLKQLQAQHYPVQWDACGVLHLARDDAQATAMQQAVTTLGFPSQLLTWLTQDQASKEAGLGVAHGGWWFAAGGWVNPSDYCAQLLKASKAILREHTPIHTLRPLDTGWAAYDVDGALVAEADLIVLTNATDAPRLAAPYSQALPIRAARGQTTVMMSPPATAPTAVLCRNGYWTPAIDAMSTCGASFVVDDTDLEIRSVEHAENLATIGAMLSDTQANWPAADDPNLTGKVGLRPVVPDRLPLVGQLPARDTAAATSRSRAARARVPGLYVNSGFGARGILFATLCAELLASQIAGEPLPLPKDLVRAIDPMRYAHKRS